MRGNMSWSDGGVRGDGEGRTAKRGEMLSRFGTAPESAARLGRKAAEAERFLGIHGVSVTAGSSTGPVSRALREVVEQHFAVHDTPTRNDPYHRTVALPKPVTQEIAALFNSLFGRET